LGLLARDEFDATKYELYMEPEKSSEPEGELSDEEAWNYTRLRGKGETLPQAGGGGREPIPEEVNTDAPRSGGRTRAGKR
jgi:hypothetical protein